MIVFIDLIQNLDMIVWVFGIIIFPLSPLTSSVSLLLPEWICKKTVENILTFEFSNRVRVELVAWRNPSTSLEYLLTGHKHWSFLTICYENCTSQSQSVANSCVDSLVVSLTHCFFAFFCHQLFSLRVFFSLSSGAVHSSW